MLTQIDRYKKKVGRKTPDGIVVGHAPDTEQVRAGSQCKRQGRRATKRSKRSRRSTGPLRSSMSTLASNTSSEEACLKLGSRRWTTVFVLDFPECGELSSVPHGFLFFLPPEKPQGRLILGGRSE